jgi:hypothetical protein
LIVDHLTKTHEIVLLSEREKQFVGLAVTMTRGSQVRTRNRIEKARGACISDDELNAVIAATVAVNSGVIAAMVRVPERKSNGSQALTNPSSQRLENSA